jgi:hypothetical protein
MRSARGCDFDRKLAGTSSGKPAARNDVRRAAAMRRERAGGRVSDIAGNFGTSTATTDVG